MPRCQSDYITYEADFIVEQMPSTTSAIKLISSTDVGGCYLGIKEGNLRFSIYINGDYIPIDYAIQGNTEYHALGTYDGTKICLYVNGNLVKSIDVTGKMGANVKNTITVIGAEPSGTNIESASTYYNGYIKSVRIYNRALTSDEVINNYNYEK